MGGIIQLYRGPGSLYSIIEYNDYEINCIE